MSLAPTVLSIVTVAIATAVLLALVLGSLAHSRAADTDDSAVRRHLHTTATLVGERVRASLDDVVAQTAALASFAAAVWPDRRLVARSTFASFVSHLTAKHHAPIIWAPLVAVEQIATHEQLVRAVNDATFANYSVKTTWHAAGQVAPLLYAFASTTSDDDIGRDLFGDGAREAVERALTTGDTAATALVTSIVDRRTDAVLTCSPAHDAAANASIGAACTALRVDELLSNATQGIDFEASQLRLIDVDTNATLFDRSRTSHDAAPSANVTLLFAQRQWRIEVRQTTPLESAVPLHTIVIVAVLLPLVLLVGALLVCWWRRHTALTHERLLRTLLPHRVAAALARKRVSVGADGKFALGDASLRLARHTDVTLCAVQVCDSAALCAALTPRAFAHVLVELHRVIASVVARHRRVLIVKSSECGVLLAAGLHSPTTSAADDAAAAAVDDTADRLLDVPESVRNGVDALRLCVALQRELGTMRFRVAELPSDSVDDAHMQRALRDMLDADDGTLALRLRIGVHVGDVLAGVLLDTRFDCWGASCAIAAAVQHAARIGGVHASLAVQRLLTAHGVANLFHWRRRESVRLVHDTADKVPVFEVVNSTEIV